MHIYLFIYFIHVPIYLPSIQPQKWYTKRYSLLRQVDWVDGQSLASGTPPAFPALCWCSPDALEELIKAPEELCASSGHSESWLVSVPQGLQRDQSDRGSRVCPQRVSEFEACSSAHGGYTQTQAQIRLITEATIEGNAQDIRPYWQMARFCFMVIYGESAGMWGWISPHRFSSNVNYSIPPLVFVEIQ